MATVPFDTLAFAETLRAGGFSEQQAKAATEAFAHATHQQLATKSDVDRAVLELRGEIKETKAGLLMWLLPILFTQIGALLYLILKLP